MVIHPRTHWSHSPTRFMLLSVVGKRWSELRNASIPWASMSQSCTWNELLKLEEVYILSKHTNFKKYCFQLPVVLLKHLATSYDLDLFFFLLGESIDFGHMFLWWNLTYLQRMYTKSFFPEHSWNKHQKLIPPLTNPTLFFQ